MDLLTFGPPVLEAPHAFLDAGSASWHDIERLVEQRLADLHVGQRLEIVAYDGSIVLELPRWCAATGNDLIARVLVGKKVSFCIRKGKPMPPHETRRTISQRNTADADGETENLA